MTAQKRNGLLKATVICANRFSLRAQTVWDYTNEHVQLEDIENTPEISEEDGWNEVWNEEWRHHVLNMALAELKGRIQPETYVAFEMYAIQGRPVQDVAKFLNLSVSSVYTAKSRCISTLKEIIENLEER